MPQIQYPHNRPFTEVLAELGVSADKGLSTAEVERLLKAAQLFHVLNMRNRGTPHLRKAPRRHLPGIIAHQFRRV